MTRPIALCLTLMALMSGWLWCRTRESEQGPWRYILSDGIPGHATGRFPNAHNPNTMRPQHYEFRVPRHPRENPVASWPRGRIGVAVNGVPFDPGTAEFWLGDPRYGWRYEAIGSLDLGLDDNRAHVQPTGAYHYHGLPTGLIGQLGGRRKAVRIGTAADGFPIYNDWCGGRPVQPSYRLRHGERPGYPWPGGRYDGTFTQDYVYIAGLGDLDECNGHGTGEDYHYHATEAFPFLPRCLRGTPDPSFFH
ncbi:MAG: YHYH protein [Candidatus Eremiobacterota bacterium]